MGITVKLRKEDVIRFRSQTITLTNQQIVEIAYLTKEAIEQGYTCVFEVANCHQACFYLCQKLIKKVSKPYLSRHRELVEFYKQRFQG